MICCLGCVEVAAACILDGWGPVVFLGRRGTALPLGVAPFLSGGRFSLGMLEFRRVLPGHALLVWRLRTATVHGRGSPEAETPGVGECVTSLPT